MNWDYVPVIDLFIGLAEAFIGKTSTKLPAEVLAAVQAAIDALATHRNDVITKAAFEAQRA